MTPEQVKQRIEENLGGAAAKVVDTTGTGDHFEAEVQCPEFSGKPLIKQHRMVYDALGDWMESAIHALKLTTRP